MGMKGRTARLKHWAGHAVPLHREGWPFMRRLSLWSAAVQIHASQVMKRDPDHRRGEYEGVQNPDELHSLERAMNVVRSWQGSWKVRLGPRR